MNRIWAINRRRAYFGSEATLGKKCRVTYGTTCVPVVSHLVAFGFQPRAEMALIECFYFFAPDEMRCIS